MIILSEYAPIKLEKTVDFTVFFYHNFPIEDKEQPVLLLPLLRESPHHCGQLPHFADRNPI